VSDVTRILSAIDAGDPHAAEQLLPLVYAELRKLAAGYLANEAPGHIALDCRGHARAASLPRPKPTARRWPKMFQSIK
jgi:hypothetical protein